jgi:hypothetical protein
MRCEGDACSVVEIVWDGLISAYRVYNRGTGPVRITLTSASGEMCLQIGALGEAVVYIGQFELPYQATFCE